MLRLRRQAEGLAVDKTIDYQRRKQDEYEEEERDYRQSLLDGANYAAEQAKLKRWIKREGIRVTRETRTGRTMYMDKSGKERVYVP